MKRFVLYSLLITQSACSPNPPDTQIKTATLRGPSAMAMIYMIEDQPVLQGEYNTVFEIKSEPELVKAMILDEKVDFAVLPATSAAILYNKTGKYILAAIPVWGTLFLCGSDTSIHDWNDLRGKKIYLMGQGMTPDVMFRYLAEKNGLDPDKDIKLDYSFSGHIELANAISAGIASLGVISEPLVSLIISRNPDVKSLINFDVSWDSIFHGTVPFAQTALLVKKDFAEKHPDLVDEYLEQLEASILKVNANPAETASLIVKYKILPDSALAEKSIPFSNLRYSEAGKEMDGMNEYFKVFLNFNPLIIGGKLPDEGFYYKKKNL